MAEGIVDILEPINIHHQQRYAPAVPKLFCSADLAKEIVQSATVLQTCQHIPGHLQKKR